jgi:hypothetical protein
MARGIALLAGVKDESTGGLGCEHDVDHMEKVISSAGRYAFNILKTEQATASAILTGIESAARTLVADDMFIFYFSGHGGQIPDVNEADGQDDTLCTYASEIVDKELAQRWVEFAAGVRIVMLSDCCHSGTNQGLAGMSAIQETTPVRAMKNAIKPMNFTGKIPRMNAQLIHFGACRDDQTSAAHLGGLFTMALCTIWNNGKFSGTYQQFYEAIKDCIIGAGYPQEPQFNFYGKVQPDFLDSRPFSLS